MTRYVLALVPAVLLCCSSFLGAAEPVKSGLQAGEKITTIFEPLNVNGEHAGEPHCLVCENGLSPVAMLFAREVNEPLLKLLSQLDEATAKNRKVEMGSFVVFLSDDEKLSDALKTLATKENIKTTVLAVDNNAGPKGYAVSKDADVTVVLYNKQTVVANHAFKKGELNAKAIETIVSEIPQILPAKK